MRTVNPASYKLIERPIYGSSRVGIDNTPLELIGYTAPTSGILTHELGLKQYEFSNHLGNVLTTVSDKKIPVDVGNDGTIDYYVADITSATDYYPFGSPMDGRAFSGEKYRFGFNGKENDNEVKGDGCQQDYGFRIYDSRLGRFLSPDPLIVYGKKYPELSTYQFASNTPIWGIDLDGLEVFYMSNGTRVGQIGKSTEVRVVNANVTFKQAQDLIHTYTPKNPSPKLVEITVNTLSTGIGMNEADLNVRATLATLKQAEAGYKNPPLDYNNWNGNDKFTEDTYEENSEAYSDHPGSNPSNGRSSAGAYQFMLDGWAGKDFSPESQDKAAISKGYMGEKGLAAAKEGDIVEFKKQKSGCWTSLKSWTNSQLKTEFKKNVVKELNGQSKIGTPKGELLN